MKLAYLINEYPKVSHSFIRREIRALERAGFEIQRIALRGWASQLPDPEDQDEQSKTHFILRNGALSVIPALVATFISSPVRFFRALRAAVRMAGQSRDRPLPYHLYYLAEACVVLRLMRAARSRHLHAHFGTNPAEVAMLMRLLGGPTYSFTAHGPDEFVRPMGLGEKVRHAAFAVAISSFGRSQFYWHSAHEDWPRVHVVHCGLEPSFHQGPPVPPATGPRLVCVGRLSEEKGQWLLVQALGRIRDKGVDFEMVLAGDGQLRPALTRLIESLGLSERIRITGWISSAEVREEILAARALVLPSFAEGLPVVLMEAMALRRAVLTTYVAGIPELVIHGENGWLFPAGSTDALQAALEECLAAPAEKLQAFGNAGYERVIARHSIDTEAEKLAALFHHYAAAELKAGHVA
jgi:glycosyltransferase involved in cell wall biosynthesis